MNGNVYVEYQMNKRVMRKTNNKELLDSIYSTKYVNWIKRYLNMYQITEVPLFIICNTLYKLPDTFRIQKNSFFIGDFYLFDYFYDWNYVLSDNMFNEYMVNLCIKQYIESSYLRDEIDVAYWLAAGSPVLEAHKDEKYYDEEIMAFWVERTEIQEAFALLHEAGHYLFKFIDKAEAFKGIADVHARLGAAVQESSFLAEKEKNLMVEEELFEECFCDSQAIKYILDYYELEHSISKEEYFSLIYKMLLYVYILKYIDAAGKNDIKPGDYYDYQLYELSYRMGNIYRTLTEYLLSHDAGQDMDIHETVYKEHIKLLKGKMDETRQIVTFIKALIGKNKDDFQYIEQMDECEKIQYLKDYLVLI